MTLKNSGSVLNYAIVVAWSYPRTLFLGSHFRDDFRTRYHRFTPSSSSQLNPRPEARHPRGLVSAFSRPHRFSVLTMSCFIWLIVQHQLKNKFPHWEFSMNSVFLRPTNSKMAKVRYLWFTELNYLKMISSLSLISVLTSEGSTFLPCEACFSPQKNHNSSTIFVTMASGLSHGWIWGQQGLLVEHFLLSRKVVTISLAFKLFRFDSDLDFLQILS